MIVLDTQAWIWWLHHPEKLTAKARLLLQKGEKNQSLLVSVISLWEIALKTGLGKLQLPLEINEWFRQACSYPGITIEVLSPEDAIASTQLPGEFHKDPADRFIVTLARRHGATLITSDKQILDYPHVETVW